MGGCIEKGVSRQGLWLCQAELKGEPRCRAPFVRALWALECNARACSSELLSGKGEILCLAVEIHDQAHSSRPRAPNSSPSLSAAMPALTKGLKQFAKRADMGIAPFLLLSASLHSTPLPTLKKHRFSPPSGNNHEHGPCSVRCTTPGLAHGPRRMPCRRKVVAMQRSC